MQVLERPQRTTQATRVALLLLSAALGPAACRDQPTATAERIPRPRLTALAQTTTISSSFNGTPIDADSTIWFNAAVKVSGVPTTGATLRFDHSTVQFSANGTLYSSAVAAADLTFSPTATQATTTFDAASYSWRTVVPVSFSGDVFLSGLALTVQAPLPGGINPVTWSGAFSSSTAGLSVQWKWAAAVYTQFGADYNTDQVKPVDGDKLNPYANSDHAGTPETQKPYVTPGARGGGGSNWTGGYSGTASVPVQPASNSPGGVILFSSDHLDGNIDIYTMDLDGTNVRRLTNAPGYDASADWSPDGTRVVFASDRSGNSEIYTMNADGSGVTQLTHNGAANVNAHFSPAGTKIVFQSNAGGTPDDIFVMNSDGTGVTQVTNSPGVITANPSWSPDGSKIVFISRRETPWFELYTMDADGSNITRITHSTTDHYDPAWSPDGQKIAYRVGRPDGWEIAVANTDGSGEVDLTSGPGDNLDPYWSPDGSQIAFWSGRSGHPQLYYMNGDGTGVTQMRDVPYFDYQPRWRR